ncbi:MAG: hypothetical protein OXI27_08920 [Thaumarchaeota archaeon]|nr:hypothetical protein [Nitrososphaerota archaeon]MDE0526696.1 hypothetical protein [Nitrososphaerota archaeon]
MRVAGVASSVLLAVVAAAMVLYGADAWAQDQDAQQQQQQQHDIKNPSLVIEAVTVDSPEFNRVLRDAPIVMLEQPHIVSWQATIDNDLVYAHPGGSAVLRLYDQESRDEFVEVGMGANPDNRFWVAVQTPKEGYVVVHRDGERGWYPQAKVIVSYTDRAGMTVNNGARIVVTNLDIGLFAPDSYSVHGMEGSTDPPATVSGDLLVEFLSGDPSQNAFALFPFYVAAGIGIIVGALYLTKKR